MERMFKVQTKLSLSPNKPQENIYRLRAKRSKITPNLPEIEIRQTFIESNRGPSLSPRKVKCGISGLFKNAHKINEADTYLHDKTHKLSNTNESSSPLLPTSQHLAASTSLEKKLPRSVNCQKTNRSMSNQLLKVPEQRRKVIQRTVSIVIDGKSSEVRSDKDLMNTLSKIILGQQEENKEFFIQFLDESSIHGDQQNFVTWDSALLKEMISPCNNKDVM